MIVYVYDRSVPLLTTLANWAKQWAPHASLSLVPHGLHRWAHFTVKLHFFYLIAAVGNY